MVSGIHPSMFSVTQTTARRGMVGLATGMDTNEIVRQMTMATRARIAQVQQRQTAIMWRAEAFQNVTNSLFNFQNRFMSSLSTTNMRNPSFFQSATITAQGANASAVSITGGSNATLNNFSIRSISNLATTAAFTSRTSASDNAIRSSDISSYITDGFYKSQIEGGSITLNFNGNRHTVSIGRLDVDQELLRAIHDPNITATQAQIDEHADAVIAAINRGLADAGLEGRVEARLDNGRVQLGVMTPGNLIEITAVSNNVRDALGLQAQRGVTADSRSGSVDISNAALAAATINGRSFGETLDGESITFNLDGVSRTIRFDSAEFEAVTGGRLADIDDIEPLVYYMNHLFREAFGMADATNQKVSVDLSSDGTGLVFTTHDDTSILSIASGSSDLIGQRNGARGMLGINFADANRLFQNESLTSGHANLNQSAQSALDSINFDNNDNYIDMNVNGVRFQIFNDRIIEHRVGRDEITHNFSSGTSIRDITNTINSSTEAGVRISYNTATDNFSVVATDSGTLGRVEISGASGASADFVNALFGVAGETGPTGRTTQVGQNASMVVSFDGITETTITRTSNNFTLNGMNITLNHTFQAADPGSPNPRVGDITFTAQTNTDAIVDGIRDMINAYNEIIANLTTQLNTRPNRAFQPLTMEQRREMTREEIDLWEEQAKQGLLFGDRTIQSLATDLRFAFTMPIGGLSLRDIGITVSSAWQDAGRLEIDEARLRQAIEADPERVADIFTRGGAANTTPGSQDAGIIARLDAVMERYISTSRTAQGGFRGLLIQRAGHESSPLSMTNSALAREQQLLDRDIQRLEQRLQREEARFARQFTNLEMFVSRMMAQSDWMSQQFGAMNQW